MTNKKWIIDMSEALKSTSSYDFFQLLGSNHELLQRIGEHFTIQYIWEKLGDGLSDDMKKDGYNPTKPSEVIDFIQKNKDRYRGQLLLNTPASTMPSEGFMTLPEFSTLIEILEKTKNVNRSNVNAVLIVASRKSAELKNVVDQIQSYFEHDLDQICLFFKHYFEVEKGWKFSKLNRKEHDGNKGVEGVHQMFRQMAYWILFEPEKQPIDMLMEVTSGDA